MKIRTSDGAAFEGEDAKGVVEQMRQSTPIEPEPSVEEYMRKTAKRVKVWNGAEVDPSTPEEFLRGLERAGLVVFK